VKLSLIIALFATLSVSSAAPAADTLIRVATPGALTGAIPIYLGGKKGIFNKYGLRVEIIATNSEQMNMRALASESAVMAKVLRISDVESLEYSYQAFKSEARPDLFPTEESIVNVLKTMSYEDPAFLSIPPYKYFDLSLIEELKTEAR
jgi:hypothetical protein